MRVDADVIQLHNQFTLAIIALHRDGNGIYALRFCGRTYEITVSDGVLTTKEKRAR